MGNRNRIISESKWEPIEIIVKVKPKKEAVVKKPEPVKEPEIYSNKQLCLIKTNGKN